MECITSYLMNFTYIRAKHVERKRGEVPLGGGATNIQKGSFKLALILS